MKITPELVKQLEALARLDLDADERENLGMELERILAYVAQIDELDTSDVPPTAQILECEQPLRADETRASLSREQTLANAPRKDAGHFAVPPVIGGEDGIADEGIEHA